MLIIVFNTEMESLPRDGTAERHLGDCNLT